MHTGILYVSVEIIGHEILQKCMREKEIAERTERVLGEGERM